jgi:transposase
METYQKVRYLQRTRKPILLHLNDRFVGLEQNKHVVSRVSAINVSKR